MWVSFDMQKVLITPQAVFIKKGSLLLVYDIGQKLGYCLMWILWNESEAIRGANEIATCLLKCMISIK